MIKVSHFSSLSTMVSQFSISTPIFLWMKSLEKCLTHSLIILFSIYGLSEIHGIYISISFPLLLVSTDYFKGNKRLNRCK